MKRGVIILVALVLFLLGTVPITHAQGLTPFFKHDTLWKANEEPAITLPRLSTLFGNGNNLIQDVLNTIVNLILLIGGLAAFGFIMYGGFKYIMSGPNPAGAEEGKKMIIGSIVGLMILALSYVIVTTAIKVLTGSITGGTSTKQAK